MWACSGVCETRGVHEVRTACEERRLSLCGSASVYEKRRRCPCVLPRRLWGKILLRPASAPHAGHRRAPSMRRAAAGIPSAGRCGNEKVYTFSTLQAAGRPFSVKISLPSCTEGRMCYNFFNKKPHRSLMKTRILSRHGAGPAGAARYGAPSGSGNLHTAGRRRFRTVFPPAAAGPDASRREPCFFFPFFCAVCCNVMHGNV